MAAAFKHNCGAQPKKHQYSEPWDNSDAVLIVENEKFHVHKFILGMASPVFKRMFASDMKEGQTKTVNLPGKSSIIMVQFLDLIYPSNNALTGMLH